MPIGQARVMPGNEIGEYSPREFKLICRQCRTCAGMVHPPAAGVVFGIIQAILPKQVCLKSIRCFSEIMQNGRLIYGDSSERMQQYGHQPGFIVTLLAPPELAELQAIPGVILVEPLSTTQFRILYGEETNPGAALLALAAQRGWQAEQLVPLHARLEVVFLQSTEGEAT